MKYILAGVAVFIGAPVFVWIGQIITIAFMGQVFFLFWALPVCYCILKSLFPSMFSK